MTNSSARGDRPFAVADLRQEPGQFLEGHRFVVLRARRRRQQVVEVAMPAGRIRHVGRDQPTGAGRI